MRYRGGIPVCFPQFSDFGPLGQHGFARNTAFEVLSSAPGTVSLVLRSSDATRKVWPHDFELVVTVRSPHLAVPATAVLRAATTICGSAQETLLEYATEQVTVGPDYLIQEMRVTNTGNDDFTFTAALHTYYRVKNIDKARVARLSFECRIQDISLLVTHAL